MIRQEKGGQCPPTLSEKFYSLSRKAGEGRGEGRYDRAPTLRPLTLSLSHEGRGDLFVMR